MNLREQVTIAFTSEDKGERRAGKWYQDREDRLPQQCDNLFLKI